MTIAFIILLVIVPLAITALYWWGECQYARNQVTEMEMDENLFQPTNEETMTINLNTLAKEITSTEGGKENLTIAQVKDVIAALGEHWRGVLPEQAAAEFAAIIAKAGLRSK